MKSIFGVKQARCGSVERSASTILIGHAFQAKSPREPPIRPMTAAFPNWVICANILPWMVKLLSAIRSISDVEDKVWPSSGFSTVSCFFCSHGKRSFLLVASRVKEIKPILWIHLETVVIDHKGERATALSGASRSAVMNIQVDRPARINKSDTL